MGRNAPDFEPTAAFFAPRALPEDVSRVDFLTS